MWFYFELAEVADLGSIVFGCVLQLVVVFFHLEKIDSINMYIVPTDLPRTRRK